MAGTKVKDVCINPHIQYNSNEGKTYLPVNSCLESTDPCLHHLKDP